MRYVHSPQNDQFPVINSCTQLSLLPTTLCQADTCPKLYAATRPACAMQLCAPCGAPHSLHYITAHTPITSTLSTTQQCCTCTGMCQSSLYKSLLQHLHKPNSCLRLAPQTSWNRLILGSVCWQHSCATAASRARPRSGSSYAVSLQGAAATACSKLLTWMPPVRR